MDKENSIKLFNDNWSDLKRKLKSEGSELYEKIVQLKIPSVDGKMRLTDVARKQLEKTTGEKVVTSRNANDIKKLKS